MLLKEFFENVAELVAKMVFVWPKNLKRRAKIAMWKYPKQLLFAMFLSILLGLCFLLAQRKYKTGFNQEQRSAKYKKDSLLEKSANSFNFSKGWQEIWALKKIEKSLDELMQKDTLDHQDSVLLKRIDHELNKKLNVKN